MRACPTRDVAPKGPLEGLVGRPCSERALAPVRVAAAACALLSLLAILGSPCRADAGDTTDEIAELRRRIEAQRLQLDRQRRQIEEQEQRLRDQEKMLEDLAARADRPATRGSEPTAAAPAPSAPPPGPTPPTERAAIPAPAPVGASPAAAGAAVGTTVTGSAAVGTSSGAHPSAAPAGPVSGATTLASGPDAAAPALEPVLPDEHRLHSEQSRELAREAPVIPPITARFAGVRVRIGGSLRTTVNTTTARMQPDATPFFVLPKIRGVSEGTTKFDARLSSILFDIRGLSIGGFQLGGSIYAYLFNGDLLSGKYGFYPGFAYVDATSENWRFAFGLQQDVFSPLMPSMVDRMSAMAGSGNTGNSFKTQLRAERFFRRGDDLFTLQGSLSDAIASNIKPPSLVDLDVASTENTGVPNAEARFAWTRESERDELTLIPWPSWQLAASGVTGEFRTFSLVNEFSAYDTRLWGVSAEAVKRLGRRLGLQGEVYVGRSLGEYLGTIFQTVDYATQDPIESWGGWGEVAWWWSPRFHSHGGFGGDFAKPTNPTGFRNNRTAFLNLFWDPGPMTTLAIEGTWRRTSYVDLGSNSGFSFMVSSELRF